MSWLKTWLHVCSRPYSSQHLWCWREAPEGAWGGCSKMPSRRRPSGLLHPHVLPEMPRAEGHPVAEAQALDPADPFSPGHWPLPGAAGKWEAVCSSRRLRVWLQASNGQFWCLWMGLVALPLPIRPWTHYIISFSFSFFIHSCCSVTQLCLTLCEPMDCSTPGFPVLHHLPEFAQTHVHWVNDAIQLFHPLLPPSPLALNLSQHQLQLQHQSFQWIFRVVFL